MPRNPQIVAFGYEPPRQDRRGTLIYYDHFEHTSDDELQSALTYAESHFFERLVLYPLHEETVRRLSKESVAPFYKRENRLHEWKRESGHSNVVVEGWDGKRKKYTPLEAALRHIFEKYKAPHFLYVNPETAQLLVSFSSFEEWIVKIRLVLSSAPLNEHPKLVKYQHRWDVNRGTEK